MDVADLPLERPTTSAASASGANLRDESASVLEARSALRAGEPARALEILNQAERVFGRGKLAEEREALAIEALLASGARADAAARARAFVEKHPKSPHAGRMRALAAH